MSIDAKIIKKNKNFFFLIYDNFMLVNVKKKKRFFIGQTDRHTDNSKL